MKRVPTFIKSTALAYVGMNYSICMYLDIRHLDIHSQVIHYFAFLL